MVKRSGPIRSGRIPADQVTEATVWQPPAVKSDKVFKLGSGRLANRIPATAFGAAANPAAQASSRAPRPGSKQQVISAETIKRSKPRPPKAAADVSDQSKQRADVQSAAEPAVPAAAAPKVEPQTPGIAEAPTTVDHEPAATATQGYLAGVEQGKTEGFTLGQQSGYEAGEQAGKAAGEAAARTEFEAEVNAQREVIKGLLAGFDAPLAELRAQMEQMLVPLVVQISQAVILGELKQHPEQVRRIVTAGLEAMPHGSSRLQISVNPQVVAFVRDRLALEDQPVEIVEDTQLAAGSCRIHSAQTNIDNSLSRNLRRCLSQAFKDEPGASAVIDEITESDLQQASETLFDAG